MATLALAGVGSAIGAAALPSGVTVGGAVISGAAIGQAAGALAGSYFDQRLLASGAAITRQGPRLSSLQVQSSTEGAPVARVAGRYRVTGQVIWATRFRETTSVTSERTGGKGGGGGRSVTSRRHAYSVSFAVALCEGEIDGIGRIWADGKPLAISEETYRLYRGTQTQTADPLIAGIEGADATPAYRGIAYIVLENLPLARFGNRVPQLSVEVVRTPAARSASASGASATPSLRTLGKAVALSPGSGEFSLAVEPVRRTLGVGSYRWENINNNTGQADILAALDNLHVELPACRYVSLVVSWFGDDLRCKRCTLAPRAEWRDKTTAPLSWRVAGQTRSGATLVSRTAGQPNFGGTPSDQTVIAIIRELRARDLKVLLYPFILMDIPPGNVLPDPWTGKSGQPPFPWRGRITLDKAPGQAGTSDKTSAAGAEISQFLGNVAPGDFSFGSGGVVCKRSQEWRFRRFILHYAYLCSQAGGVDAFCIGSELRGLTQIRSRDSVYPFVDGLVSLARDVRTLLGRETKISYAADWSEYFGHHPADGSGDVLFHLDPLWASADIDFIGIDNYFPLADWRKGATHRDRQSGHTSIYSRAYLQDNIASGEGYDWYYASPSARDAQIRTPIRDASTHGEDWVFRPKDIVSWWENAHHDRLRGVRSSRSTAWVPKSKPVWFTETGCPAVDMGANQPNVFFDPKSSESALPHYSSGARDDVMQRRFLEALLGYWANPANNPASDVYKGRMVDMEACFLWTWDARPFPDFPARRSVWSDAPNYLRGHWLEGRLGAADLSDLVAELCARSGLGENDIDVSRLTAAVRGFRIERPMSARDALQPLMLAFGFEAVESGGKILFLPRGSDPVAEITTDDMVVEPDGAPQPPLIRAREASNDVPRTVRLHYAREEREHRASVVEIHASDAAGSGVVTHDLPVLLTTQEARRIAQRLLTEARTARETSAFSLPPSFLRLEPGDALTITQGDLRANYRIDAITDRLRRDIQASRIDTALYVPRDAPESESPEPPLFQPPAPVEGIFLDLPMLSGNEIPHAPHFAAFADPWPGQVALWKSASGETFDFALMLDAPIPIGSLLTPLPAGSPGRWWRGSVKVQLSGAHIASRTALDVLNGANVAALQSPSGEWEILQFQDAEMEDSQTYVLSMLLRGQRGTEHLAANPLPAESRFVLLTDAPGQLPLSLDERGLERRYRFGPAAESYLGAAYRSVSARFDGVGLRPFSPAHLRVRHGKSGDVSLSWVRRTRIGGDRWEEAETPLSEAREAWRVRLVKAGAQIRAWTLSAPAFTYTSAARMADSVMAPYTFFVAQLSESFGAGPERSLTIDA